MLYIIVTRNPQGKCRMLVSVYDNPFEAEKEAERVSQELNLECSVFEIERPATRLEAAHA